jgi:glycerate-2-kinase
MGGPAAALRAEQHRCTAIAHQDKCVETERIPVGLLAKHPVEPELQADGRRAATVLLAVGNAAALVVLVLLLGGGSPHRPFLAQPTADRRCPAVQVGLRFGVF